MLANGAAMVDEGQEMMRAVVAIHEGAKVNANMSWIEFCQTGETREWLELWRGILMTDRTAVRRVVGSVFRKRNCCKTEI
jgi:hypothetical protein